MAIDKNNKCKSGHRLYEADWVTDYRCEGCEMSGSGKAQGCKACEYYLHPECWDCRTTISHEIGILELCKRWPRGKGEGRKKSCRDYFCDACGLQVKGDFYYSTETDIRLHPLCALPKKEISAVPAADKDRLAVNLLPSKKPEYRKAVQTQSAPRSAVVTTAAKNINNGSPTLQGYSKKKKTPYLIKYCPKIFRTILAVVVSVLIGDPTTILFNTSVEALAALLQFLRN